MEGPPTPSVGMRNTAQVSREGNERLKLVTGEPVYNDGRVVGCSTAPIN